MRRPDSWFRTLLSTAVTLLAAACGETPTEPPAPVQELWRFSVTVTDSSGATTCTATGTLTFRVDGDSLVGGGYGPTLCLSGTRDTLFYDPPHERSFLRSTITSARTSIQVELFNALIESLECDVEGAGLGAGRVTGPATCQFALLWLIPPVLVQRTLRGSWHAERAAP